MFLASEHMRRVRVRASSVDDTVTATMSTENGVDISFKRGSLRHHDVRSLTNAVTTAVSRMLDAYRKAGDEVMRRVLAPDALEDAWQTPAGRRLRPFVEALEALEVSATGPRGVAKVGLSEGKFRAAFRDQALKLHESELSGEIESAVSSMYDYRSAKAVRLYDELVIPEGERDDHSH